MSTYNEVRSTFMRHVENNHNSVVGEVSEVFDRLVVSIQGCVQRVGCGVIAAHITGGPLGFDDDQKKRILKFNLDVAVVDDKVSEAIIDAGKQLDAKLVQEFLREQHKVGELFYSLPKE